jgi:uroporphyrinogen-III decarboxylase
MTKFFFDLYRMPDKIQAVMDVILEELIAEINACPPVDGIGGTWVGGWRAASALVAPKLWDRFVWPYYLKIVDALVSVGIIPVLHWDQNWTRDLVRLQELPAKKCILNPDGMTDMRKFKELVGNHMAMMGDIPASVLAAGTPDDVHTYVREQVELFEGRGLILCPGCDAPLNAKPENMEAFVEAAHIYGRGG